MVAERFWRDSYVPVAAGRHGDYRSSPRVRSLFFAGIGGAASAGEMAVEGEGGDTEPTSDLFDGDHWVAEERLGGLQVVRGKCRRPATKTATRADPSPERVRSRMMERSNSATTDRLPLAH